MLPWPVGCWLTHSVSKWCLQVWTCVSPVSETWKKFEITKLFKFLKVFVTHKVLMDSSTKYHYNKTKIDAPDDI